MLENVTPLILTWNEETNIVRCLEKLRWAKRVLVVDSFSTDGTLDLIRQFPNTEILQKKFDDFASQTGWGIGQIHTEWVLSIDADYILTEALIQEMSALNLAEAPDGYFVSFKYCMSGKPLRSTLLPPREILFRKANGKYIQDGHAHKLVNTGISGTLKNFLYHDDRKSFARWWVAQKKYSKQEARKLSQASLADLNVQDKLRKMIIFAPLAVFFYCLFYHGLILEGIKGIVYSIQRFLAEWLLSLSLLKRSFK